MVVEVKVDLPEQTTSLPTKKLNILYQEKNTKLLN
jgi:hypothetical protein